jgi:hypothetical protein
MSNRISEAKRAFSEAFDGEIDDIEHDLRDIATRARAAAKVSTGLNQIAQGFNGLASTIETALTQADDVRTEQRKWLGVTREPIHERVSSTAMEIQA